LSDFQNSFTGCLAVSL